MHPTGLKSLQDSILTLKRDPSSGVAALEAENALSSFSLRPYSLPLSRIKPLLLDLECILESSSNSSGSLLKSILSFYRMSCLMNEELRVYLRDKTGLFRVAITLLSRSQDSSSKALAVLQLLRVLSLGFKVPRFEWHNLQELLPQLKKIIANEERDLSCASVFILLCLCKKNPGIAKAILPQEDIKSFFLTEQSDPKLQVLFNILSVALIQAGEVERSGYESFTAGGAIDMKDLTTLIVETFCGAYADDDVLLMRLLSEFWSTNLKKRDRKKEIGDLDILGFVRKIVQLADFGEGSNDMSNECLFEFLRLFVQCSRNGVVDTFKTMLKLVALRLDSFPSSSPPPFRQTLLCLRDCIHLLGDHDVSEVLLAQSEDEDQLNTVLSLIVDLYPKGSLGDCLSSLKTLRAICKADVQWNEKISLKIGSPDELIRSSLERIKEEQEDSSCCHSPLLLDLIGFCRDMNGCDWKKGGQEMLLKDRGVMGILSNCLRDRCHPLNSKDLLQVLASVSNNDDDGADNNNSEMEHSIDDELSELEFYRPLPNVLENKINSTIYSLQKTMLDSDLDNITSMDIYELGNFQKYASDLRSEVLRQSLSAAKETIASQRKENALLEIQTQKITRVMSKMIERDDARRIEISKIRAEFESTQSSTNSLKKELKHALEDKNAELSNLQEEYDKLRTKALRYKEDIDTLQATIQEHHEVQKELQESVKSEKKVNSEMVATLEKLENKLRKKERQLDEEMHSKQRTEKELETLKKEFTSIQVHSKRQLEKKDKQITEANEELASMKQIQDQIFNLSKLRSAK